MNKTGLMMRCRRYGLGLILAWSCILAAFLTFIINVYHKDTIKEATREARDYYELNLQYRRWSARLGGVYAPSDKVTPNPHLIVIDRDVTTNSGKSLTLVNPAYMTRMVFESIRKESHNPIINRLVSLKPLNPANAPNAWEQETLRLFEKMNIKDRSQLLMIDNHPYLQFMAAFITEEACLKCHAQQGYRLGDVRGGMSIAIPMNEYLALERERVNSLLAGVALLWVLGSAGIALSSNRRFQQEMLLIEERVKLEKEGEERQQAVVALQKTEHFLQTIIDSEPECVKLLDANCNLVLMNRAGLEMIEAGSIEQVRGQCILPLVNGPYRKAFTDLTQQAFQGTPGNLEFEITGLKGRSLWLNSLAVPFRDEHDTIVAVLAITRNISELKQTTGELQKKNADMEQFIYTTSHDLRTPMVTVKTFLGYLERDMAGNDRERVAQDLQFIHDAADKMTLLLDDLQELSRIDHIATPPVKVSLLRLAADAVNDLAGIINERKAVVRMPDTDQMFFADSQHLRQIWHNLIENAIKYSRNDCLPRIELGVRQENGETIFFVKDNGIGIDLRYGAKIFKMFEKLDPLSDGAGLGLSMIQRIVEKYGGRIWVESEGIGKGSCFCFTLPDALLFA